MKAIMEKVMLRCDCSLCKCSVEAAHAVRIGGQHFCSNACATGHPNMEACQGQPSGCSCGTGELEFLLLKTS